MNSLQARARHFWRDRTAATAAFAWPWPMPCAALRRRRQWTRELDMEVEKSILRALTPTEQEQLALLLAKLAANVAEGEQPSGT